MITNLNVSASIAALGKLPGTLKSVGITPPKALVDAVRFSRAETGFTRLAAARSRLAQCTAEEYPDAAQDLAMAYTTELVAEHNQHYADELTKVKYNRLFLALADHESEIFDKLCAEFNAVAPAFEEAARALPDMVRVDQWSWNDNELAALPEVRKSSAILSTLWQAYRQVAKALSHIEPAQRELSDYINEVFMLGQPNRFTDATNAAQCLYEYGLGVDGSKAYKPIMPFYALTQINITLHLKHPDSGRALRREVQGV